MTELIYMQQAKFEFIAVVVYAELFYNFVVR